MEQVSFGLVHFVQLGLVGHCFDSVLQWRNVIVAGHYDHGLEIEPFSEAHRADRDVPFAFFHAVGELQRCLTCLPYYSARPQQFIRTSDEDADLVGFDAVFNGLMNPEYVCFYQN